MERTVPKKKSIILLLLVCVFFFAVARSEQGGEWMRRKVFAACAPFVKAGGYIATGFKGAARAVQSRRSLIFENAELKKNKFLLSKSEITLEELRLENERLRALLMMPREAELKTVAAEVVGRTPNVGLIALTINKGSGEGVEKDMAVLTPAGVVGRVWSVSGGASLVQLITDRNSGLAALVQRTRLQGIVIGTGGGAGSLKYIPKPEDIKPGDRIVASGLDGIYPKGLEVGVVDSVSDPPGFFKEVTVRFSVAFNRLEDVLVVDSRRRDVQFSESLELAVMQ